MHRIYADCCFASAKEGYYEQATFLQTRIHCPRASRAVLPLLRGSRTGSVVFQPDRALSLPSALGGRDRMPWLWDDPRCGLPAPFGFRWRMADAPTRLCGGRVLPAGRVDVDHRQRESPSPKASALGINHPVCGLVGNPDFPVFAWETARFSRTASTASPHSAPAVRKMNRPYSPHRLSAYYLNNK